jgi:lipopolysaccharide/colanic/teichoic acid biosynthesis glycosyltransferase
MTRITGPAGLYSRGVKRALDLVGGCLLLVATAPLHGICALAVVLDSGRPVYFQQRRTGHHGREFRLHKLRTMVVGTDERSGGYPTADMVTGVGAFLRRCSLDELPQLVNIVRGDMSFVGPRPALPDQVRRYTTRQRRRLEVRPGLTGLAQVRHRNDAPWSVRIESDIEYVDRMSLLTDLRVLLMTLPAVLSGSGQRTGQTAADVDDLPALDSETVEPGDHAAASPGTQRAQGQS